MTQKKRRGKRDGREWTEGGREERERGEERETLSSEYSSKAVKG